MKAKILSIEGKQGKEIELPACFSYPIREDITQKCFEAEKKIQPYAPFILSGRQFSASGQVKHGRGLWKTAYGHGISRIPRKILWRRGTQFNWVGASVVSTRGGRIAHPPRVEHFLKIKKINKKEKKIAVMSIIASTTKQDYTVKRYSSIENIKGLPSMPVIVEDKILNLKTKDFFKTLALIFPDLENVILKKRKIRAGKGKSRNRKYKENAGLLFIIGNKEEKKINGIEVKKVSQLQISDLWPLGRLTLYTEQAIKDFGEIGDKNVGRERR